MGPTNHFRAISLLRYVAARFLMLAVVLVPATGIVHAASAPAGPVPMQVFNCENLSQVVVRYLPDAVDLRLPNRVLILPRSADPSEQRYSANGVTFWNAGNYASIEGPDGKYVCRNSPAEVAWEEARSRGIDVRAAGEDPEWSLEIDEGKGMEFVADSGATHVSTTPPLPDIDPALDVTTYRARTAGHTLHVVLESRLCWFRANPAASSATVTVTLDGNKVYHGCGRPLPSGRLAVTVVPGVGVAFPVRAQLRLRIVKLSAPSRDVIAEQTVSIESTCSTGFDMSYDLSRIYGDDAYGIEAAVSIDGKLYWTNRVVQPVLTRGSVSSTEIVLGAVGRSRRTGAESSLVPERRRIEDSN